MKREIKFKNGFKPRSTIRNNDEGTLIIDKEDVTKEFKKIFKKMLNISTKLETEGNTIFTLKQYLEEQSLEEIKIVVGMIKRGKAPGEDAIMSELLKKGGSILMIKLKQLQMKYEEKKQY